ncbi:MAG: hypothetical protein ACE5JU_17950 [Candidatus Binatia bacterium]
MNYPFRENLEVFTDTGGRWIRCIRCVHVLCQVGQDWKKACKRRIFPPTKAGPLMRDLLGHYLLEKLYCPSCGALLNSDMVEQG